MWRDCEGQSCTLRSQPTSRLDFIQCKMSVLWKHAVRTVVWKKVKKSHSWATRDENHSHLFTSNNTLWSCLCASDAAKHFETQHIFCKKGVLEKQKCSAFETIATPLLRWRTFRSTRYFKPSSVKVLLAACQHARCAILQKAQVFLFQSSAGHDLSVARCQSWCPFV